VACFAFLVALGARSAFLAAVGAGLAASVELPSRLWIAFQIRLTADFRSVNFLRREARNAVPDLDQPVRWPLGDQAG